MGVNGCGCFIHLLLTELIQEGHDMKIYREKLWFYVVYELEKQDCSEDPCFKRNCPEH